jgi:hypothetical protein
MPKVGQGRACEALGRPNLQQAQKQIAVHAEAQRPVEAAGLIVGAPPPEAAGLHHVVVAHVGGDEE